MEICYTEPAHRGLAVQKKLAEICLTGLNVSYSIIKIPLLWGEDDLVRKLIQR